MIKSGKLVVVFLSFNFLSNYKGVLLVQNAIEKHTRYILTHPVLV